MIGLIQMILPGTKKIGTLYSPGEFNSVRNMNYLKQYAERGGIELITVPVNSSSETADAALSLMARKPEIVCQIVDNLTSLSSSSVIAISRENHIPMFGFVSEQSEKGAVLVLSRDYLQAGIDATRLAKKILDGMKPAEIPFEFVSRTEILINPAAAAQYGIIIPEEIINRDNTIIVK
jgi:putative ABC transport system substrate-binding protein